MKISSSRERILNQIKKRLCPHNAPDREREWRTLVRDLRRQGREASVTANALTEFLSVTAESVAPGMRTLSPADYHRLSVAERAEVEKLYLECLTAAMRDFPYVFQVDVINVPTSPADVVLAERAASPELPRLNADQQSLAKALGIPEQGYARGALAKQYSEDRYRFYAERCWDFLMGAAKAHSIDAVGVVYDVSSARFFCEMRWHGTVRRFTLNARIVSEPLEAGDKSGLDRAREAIRFAVEQAIAPRMESAGVEVTL